MKTIALTVFLFLFVAIPKSYADGSLIMSVYSEYKSILYADKGGVSDAGGFEYLTEGGEAPKQSELWIEFYGGFMNPETETCIHFEPGKSKPTLKECDRYSKTLAKAIGDTEKKFAIGVGDRCLWANIESGIGIGTCGKEDMEEDYLWRMP